MSDNKKLDEHTLIEILKLVDSEIKRLNNFKAGKSRTGAYLALDGLRDLLRLKFHKCGSSQDIQHSEEFNSVTPILKQLLEE